MTEYVDMPIDTRPMVGDRITEVVIDVGSHTDGGGFDGQIVRVQRPMHDGLVNIGDCTCAHPEYDGMERHEPHCGWEPVRETTP